MAWGFRSEPCCSIFWRSFDFSTQWTARSCNSRSRSNSMRASEQDLNIWIARCVPVRRSNYEAELANNQAKSATQWISLLLLFEEINSKLVSHWKIIKVNKLQSILFYFWEGKKKERHTSHSFCYSVGSPSSVRFLAAWSCITREFGNTYHRLHHCHLFVWDLNLPAATPRII